MQVMEMGQVYISFIKMQIELHFCTLMRSEIALYEVCIICNMNKLMN
jgi:hypothetical protein